MKHLILFFFAVTTLWHMIWFFETILGLIFYHCKETSDIQVKKGTVKYTERKLEYILNFSSPFSVSKSTQLFFSLDRIFKTFLSFPYCDQPPCSQDFPQTTTLHTKPPQNFQNTHSIRITSKLQNKFILYGYTTAQVNWQLFFFKTEQKII